MAVSTVEQKFFNKPVLVVTYRGTVDVNDLAHGAGMTSIFVENAENRPYVLIDISEIDEKSLSIITLIMTRSAAVLSAVKDAKILIITGEGMVQEYLDVIRQDQFGLTTLPVIPRFEQALTTIQLLLNMERRKNSVA